ncbi:hypothetical protein QAD02_023975 [Eretmocerus hayati]|uniref:Uncharacterized protein n=1 Tax=Eretmocerus hayati TaxID=131215 RepID=A0ACC2PX50_9HYME|nr:hypothetical protein QAD02_023975 [Eretmocerus hayati]
MIDPMHNVCSSSEDLGFCKEGKQTNFENEWKSYRDLKLAIQNGQKTLARSLIQQGAMLNPKTGRHITPLHMAIHLGCPDLIKTLLDYGASVNETWHRETPIIFSVRLRKFHLTDLLLTSNSLKNSESGIFAGPMNHLHIACLRGQIHAVKKLIKLGADIHCPVESKSFYWPGYTPLHLAVESQCIDLVEFLLNCGASIMVKNSHSCTPIHLAHEIRNEPIIDILLNAHMYELEDAADERGLSHFHIACTRNNVSVVEYFLNQGCNINFPTICYVGQECRGTPLELAMDYECLDVVELLLLHDAQLAFDEFHNCMPLAYGIGNEKIIQLLLNGSTRSMQDLQVAKLSDFQHAFVNPKKGRVGTFILKQVPFPESFIADINKPIWNGFTPLHYSINYCFYEVIRALKSLGADASIADSKMRTPLHIAFVNLSQAELESIICDLVDYDTNPANLEGLTHFHISCTTDKIDLIYNFLKVGKNVDLFVDDDSTLWAGYGPLHFAVKFKRIKTVEILLKHGFNFVKRNGNTASLIDLAISNLNGYPSKLDIKIALEILKEIVSKFESMPTLPLDNKGVTFLHVLCISEGELDFRELLKYIRAHPEAINTTINCPDSRYHGCAPLHLAMQKGNVELSQWLLQKGANLNIENSEGMTPLDYEIKSMGKFGILKANPAILRIPGNPVNVSGLSNFHIACKFGNIEIMEYYLKSGVDIDVRTTLGKNHDCSSRTALQLVIRDNRDIAVETATYLLSHGADATATDAYLKTPLHTMKHSSYSQLIDVLVDYGADVNAQNIFGRTPLHYVCRFPLDYEDAKENIVALLGNGADINILDEHGLTPFTAVEDLDAESDLDETVCILLEHAKKLEVLGRYFSDVNKKYRASNEFWRVRGNNYNEQDFEKKCLKEIARLKRTKVGRHLTLYRVLSKSSNRMVGLSKNPKFRAIVQSDKFNSDYPIYGYLLKLQYKVGLIRQPLLEKCVTLLSHSLDLSRELSDKILEYLSDRDLRNIIKSVNVSCS